MGRNMKRVKLLAANIAVALIIISIGIVFKSYVFDHRITKVYYRRDSPNEACLFIWPEEDECANRTLSWLEEVETQLERQIFSLNVDTLNASDTNITFKLNKLIEDQKMISERITELKQYCNQQQETLTNMPSVLIQVRKMNQSFKEELLKKFPRHEQDFDQIIKAVESTQTHIDKRILSIRFLSQKEAFVSTGFWNKSLQGRGYSLYLVKSDNKWNVERFGFRVKIGLSWGTDEEQISRMSPVKPQSR